jgi:hypothetical protein
MYTKLTVEEIFGNERGQLVWAAINTCVRELFEEYKNMYFPSDIYLCNCEFVTVCGCVPWWCGTVVWFAFLHKTKLQCLR